MANARETIEIDIDVDERSVASLTAQMDRLKDAMTRTTDEHTFQKLAKEAGELKYEIDRGEEAINEFARSQDGLMGVSAAFGSIGNSLLSLDFDRALDGANRLNQISSSISFGDAIGSLKRLGQTFATIGKTLLTNPIFLIGAVIAAIGYAIYKLMDELGLLQVILDGIGKVFEWLMIPINALIDGLKSLTDWFGWTDNAGEELAASTIENNEKMIASNKKRTDSLISQYDHEIAIMKATGQESSKLERKRLEEIQEARKEEVQLALESAQSIAKLKGKDSEEYKTQMKAIEEIRKAFKQGRREIELFDIQQSEKAKERLKKEQEEEQALRQKGIDAWKAAQAEKEALELETAERQEEINLKLEEFKINQIEDEIERAEKLALFREENDFERIDRTLLTNEQIEQLEANHLTMMAQIREEAEEKRQAIILAKEEADKIAADKEIAEAQKVADAKLSIEQKRIEEEARLLQASQDSLVTNTQNLFSSLGSLAKEGSATQKALAMANIIASQAEAIAKAVPVALTAASGTGPAAPFVFASTLVGLGASIAASIASAKQVLSSGGSSGGGGGGSVSAPRVSIPETPTNTPQINMYGNTNDTGGDSNQFDSVNRGNTPPIKAYVSWSDLEETESNNNKVLNQMAL